MENFHGKTVFSGGTEMGSEGSGHAPGTVVLYEEVKPGSVSLHMRPVVYGPHIWVKTSEIEAFIWAVSLFLHS